MLEGVTYHVGFSTIHIAFGDILASNAEVIVSSDDYRISMGGGVSGAIRFAGGMVIHKDARKMVPSRAGEVVITTAGDLEARYIFHAITIGPNSGELPPGVLIRQATKKAMSLLGPLGCSSIAFPAIGTGAAQLPVEVVLAEMGSTFVDSLLDNPDSIKVSLVLQDRFGSSIQDHLEGDFFEKFEESIQRKYGLDCVFYSGEPQNRAFVLKTDDRSPRVQADTGVEIISNDRKAQIFSMLRHLDSRRNALEGQLVSHLGDNSLLTTDLVRSLNEQLIEILRLRATYETELAQEERALEPTKQESVFVSSTSSDLQPHRSAVRSVIDKLSMTYIGMEDFPPESSAPADMIRRRVVESESYLGILGMRYGYIDNITGLSMTELEYRQAIASDKEVRFFVMHEDAPITANMVERDPESLSKLNEFRDLVLKSHSCNLFTTQEDLAGKVERALGAQ